MKIIMKLLSGILVFILFSTPFFTGYTYADYLYNPKNNVKILNPNFGLSIEEEEEIEIILENRHPVIRVLLKIAKQISNKAKKGNISPDLIKYAKPVARYFKKIAQEMDHVGKISFSFLADLVKQAGNQVGMTWSEAYRFITEVIKKW